MATLSLVSRPPKGAGADVPLYIRISHKSRTRYLSTGIKLHPRHWNENRAEVRKSHPDYQQLNVFLRDQLAVAESALLDLQTSGRRFTVGDLKDAAETKLQPEEKSEPLDFLVYARQLADDYERRGQLSTAAGHRVYLNKLEDFLIKRGRGIRREGGGRALPFDAITPAFLRGWQSFLAEEHGNGTNTIAKNLSDLRTDLYTAIREGHLGQGDNPFFHIKIKEKRTKKRALTRAELARLEALDLPDEKDTYHGGRQPGVSRTTLLRDVRNAFVFSVYSQGMRWSDLATLTWHALRMENGALRLSYRMRKNGKTNEMLLPTPAVGIVQFYEEKRGGEERVFPALDGEDVSTKKLERRGLGRKLALYNKYLKKLQQQAGISTRITFHIARHTFANIALDLGFDVRDLNAALQHGTLRTTETYIEDLKQSRLDEKMRRFG